MWQSLNYARRVFGVSFSALQDSETDIETHIRDHFT